MMTEAEPLYLDHAATTPLRREALEAMWPWLTARFANPSSPHGPGREARAALEAAREELARGLGCRAGELIFTSGGTEADNLAIKGIALGVERPPAARRLIISPFEHPAVEGACDYLCRHHGYRLERLAVDRNGLIDLDDLARRLALPAALCSVILGHNEIGTLQPIERISAIARAHGVALHVDAVQAAGWEAIDVERLGIAALSLSGHKLGAGRGIGALFLRRGVPLEPLLHGGHQERGRRGGTEQLPGVIALARAFTLARAEAERHGERVAALRDAFIRGVLEGCPGARLTGAAERRLPHHASFLFPGTHGEAVLLALEARGVICSSGSACKAGEDEPSPALLALGISRQEAQTAVRFCFDIDIDQPQVDRAVRAVVEAVAQVRGLGGR
ncbi:cysteine desulfurase family protein [Halotalea alkalilenta]|nr:cysteine desulfurase family protein [Halotalea alkalilenta]